MDFKHYTVTKPVKVTNEIPKGSFRTMYSMDIPDMDRLFKGKNICSCQIAYCELDDDDQAVPFFKVQNLSVDVNGELQVPDNFEDIWTIINNIISKDTQSRYYDMSFKDVLSAIHYDVWSMNPKRLINWNENIMAKDYWYYAEDDYLYIGHLTYKTNAYNYKTKTEYVNYKHFDCDWVIPISVYEKMTAGLQDHLELEKEKPELPLPF